MVEASKDAIIAVNVSGNVVIFNQAAEEMFGIPTEEMLGSPLNQIIPPKLKQQHHRTLTAFLSNGVSRCGHINRTMEQEAVRADGTTFPVEISLSAGRANGLRLVVAVIRDITERKKAEEVLRESEEKFRAAFETSPDLFYRVSPDGKIQECNDEALKVLGYSKEEITGMPLFNIYAEESRPVAKELFEEWKETGKLRNKELKIVTKDGKKIDIELNVNTIYDSKGNIISTISSQRDITERKKGEAALRLSQETLQKTYDTIPEAVITIDTYNKIVSCNKSVESILGYTTDELVGKDYSIVVPEKMLEDPEREPREKKLFEKGYLAEQDFYFRRKSGEIFPAGFSVALIRDKEGNPMGMVGTIRDITEQKQAEEKLKQKIEELERWQKVTVDREVKMIELKKEIKELKDEIERLRGAQ